MATQYACIQVNDRKLRLVYYKSYSTQLPKKLALIDFEKNEKYINSNCSLDFINSKIVSKILNGLISVKISSEDEEEEITLTIGKNNLKLKKEQITSEDWSQEQHYLSEKKLEKVMKALTEFHNQLVLMKEDMQSLKERNEELEKALHEKNEALLKIATLNAESVVVTTTATPVVVTQPEVLTL